MSGYSGKLDISVRQLLYLILIGIIKLKFSGKTFIKIYFLILNFTYLEDRAPIQ